MSGFFSLLQPAPILPEIQDPHVIEKQYPYWRWRIFYSMFVGYAFYYLTRKSFTFAMPALIQDLGFDKGELGLIATIWAFAYGLSKFFSGIVSDHSNARYFMSFGLIMTGVCNILFGFSSSLWLLALFWALNGWFQGCGWPPCARLLTYWYSRSERGSWWSTWNVSHNIGGALIPILAGFSAMHWGWRFALYVPGVISIIMGLWLMERLRDTPRSLGLPTIETYRNDHCKISENQSKEELSPKQILWEYVLKNKAIWLLACAYFFVYTVRTGFNDWTALFLVESKGYSQLGANSCVSLFEAGGFCGNLLAGWASDYLFNARRGPVNALFALGIAISTGLFWMIPQGHVFLDAIMMFFIGLTVFGPQMLIGLFTAELSHKKAAATATGFIGGFAYVGSATAGYPLGKITQDWGWDGFFWLMGLSSLFTIVLLFPLWNTEKEETAPLTA